MTTIRAACALWLILAAASLAEAMAHGRYMNSGLSNCVSSAVLPESLHGACQVWLPMEFPNRDYVNSCGLSANARFGIAALEAAHTLPTVTNGYAVFDGTSNAMNCLDTSLNCMTAAAPRTVALWIYLTNSTPTEREILYWGQPGNGNRNGQRFAWSLGGVYSNLCIRWSLDATYYARTAAGTLTPGAWHHVGYSYNGGDFSNSTHIRIDSVDMPLTIAGTGVLTTLDVPTTRALGVHRGTKGTTHWQGYMDDVMIFDRQLTALEWTNLYQMGRTTQFLPQRAPETGTVDIAVFIGQSNERGYITDFADTNVFAPYAQAIAYPVFWANVAQTHYYQDVLQRPYNASVGFSHPSCLVFGHLWSDHYALTGDMRTDKTLKNCVLIDAEDSKAITNWSRLVPNSKWGEVTNLVNQSTTNFALRGWTPRWRYIAIAQGESDAYATQDATGWADQATCLVTSFWGLVHQTGRVYLTCIHTNLSTHAPMTNYATVRTQQTVTFTQRLYSAGITNCAVTTAGDGWPRLADQIHYNGTGLIMMGVDRWNDYRVNVLGEPP